MPSRAPSLGGWRVNNRPWAAIKCPGVCFNYPESLGRAPLPPRSCWGLGGSLPRRPALFAVGAACLFALRGSYSPLRPFRGCPLADVREVSPAAPCRPRQCKETTCPRARASRGHFDAQSWVALQEGVSGISGSSRVEAIWATNGEPGRLRHGARWLPGSCPSSPGAALSVGGIYLPLLSRAANII